MSRMRRRGIKRFHGEKDCRLASFQDVVSYMRARAREYGYADSREKHDGTRLRDGAPKTLAGDSAFCTFVFGKLKICVTAIFSTERRALPARPRLAGQ